MARPPEDRGVAIISPVGLMMATPRSLSWDSTPNTRISGEENHLFADFSGLSWGFPTLLYPALLDFALPSFALQQTRSTSLKVLYFALPYLTLLYPYRFLPTSQTFLGDFTQQIQ